MRTGRYTRFIVTLMLLLMCGAGGVWADGVTIFVEKPNGTTQTFTESGGPVELTGGSVSVAISGRDVTLTVTPADGYKTKKDLILVEKMVNPNQQSAPRRAPGLGTFDLTGTAEWVTGSTTYTFNVPTEYDGAYVTVTFVSTSTTATQITSLSEISNNLAGTYELAADVDASGFNGLGEFTGTLDGKHFTIHHLNHPLFASTNGATIRNINFENVNITSGDANGDAGAITSLAKGATRIYNCGILPSSVERDNAGNITGFSGSSIGGSGNVGGLVGKLAGTARVINCFSYATITGGENVGGIVGNNTVTTTASSINTMVMNCMFYGDITGGSAVSPVYGGNNINNLQGGLNTFNYYSYENLKTKQITDDKYNCALAVEDKYLNRFEYYRLLLNSNKKLAAFYATGSHANANQMAKWVLETADRSISGRDPYPYPILKAQGEYPSIINPDIANAPDSATVGRNHGGKLGKTLTVNISNTKTDGGQTWPSGANITTNSLPLQRTDKDFDRFNFNYDKVQLPYYDEVGTGNYTGNRVVTGWKITAISEVEDDPYTAANYPTTGITDSPNHNYADRKSSNKDLYTVSKRVFSQGAYFDVPYGVTSITIEPYWGKAAYIADPNYDVVYKNDYSGKQNVTQTGTQVGSGATFNNETSQVIKTSVSDALSHISTNLGGYGSTVYDNAVVLVGNLHLDNVPSGGDTPFTMMSVDKDSDHEPDYSLIYHHKSRTAIAPIRFDFLNIPGTAQAQKPNTASLICNFTIFKTKGWFEVTNTSSFYTSQLEYENLASITKVDAPLILLGGVIDQFVSTQSSDVNGKTIYIHVGGNVWINSFGLGTHSDGSKSTPHVPVSVTGGEFPGFYLTGTYKADATVRSDNAECYISGGYFHEAAGASLEQIDGDVYWQIYNADIDNFFGGGINDAKPITGNITTDIYNSYVKLFCGGPKFGNMQETKEVTTNAEGCTFGKFFGAGYGGTSIAKKKYYDLDSYNWSTLQGYYTTDRGKYFDGATTKSSQISGKDYGKKGPGVATDFDYEFFVWSSGATGARFFVKFAAFSLAQCNDVSSTLKKCTIETNFYGGGNLGKVVGTATSELEDCIVKGSVYGAGYSASLPTVEVRNGGFTKDPNYNDKSGMFEPGVFSGTTTFTWQNATVAGKTLTNGQSGSDLTNHILYTGTELTGLGEVANTVLKITGTTSVGESVYGGGEESGVGENTEVTITGGTIGAEDQGGVEYGNVYGGGKGKSDNVTAGLVKGNTKVTISQAAGKTTRVYHNVYGGGAYGSVGTFAYNANNVITGHTANTGKAEVYITGGTFGWNGKENGMVFGSSRGDVGAPGNIEDKLAWVYDTKVYIGTSGSGSVFTTPTVMGSVYGGGENGHVYNDAEVNIYSGTIGVPTGEIIIDNNGTPNDDTDDVPYSGAQYPYRGNVYGGGCGTDKYYSGTIPDGHTATDGKGDTYNPKAGIVQGTTTVNISGGHVVHNVYGAGAMGSVGGGTTTDAGKTTINVTGGRIGYDGTNNEGNVFGAARGDLSATGDLAQVRETKVNINYSTTPTGDNTDKSVQLIAGSVFGGGEAGTVKESVALNMTGGLVLKDVYGGGALADTQTSNWNATGGTDGKGDWATGKTSASSTTTVRLTGGTILGEAYGGALGEKTGVNGATSDIAAYVYGDVLLDLNGTTSSGETGAAIDNTAKGCVVGQIFGCNNINGSPKGDVMVHVYATQNKQTNTIAQKFILEKDSNTEKGGSESDADYVARLQGILTGKIALAEALSITVSQENKDLCAAQNPTVTALTTAITSITTSINAKTTEEINAVRYDVEAVYGGGNMAAYVPVTPYKPTDAPTGAKSQVIIEGCEVTSINTVYGGGNAAAVPETNVTIKSAYEIGYLFGGGNGKDKILINNVLTDNPGADIGQYHNGTEMVTYGTGNANSLMEGGYIHEAYGGSNTKGVVKGSLNQTSNPEGSTCDLAVDKIVGAGKYADIDGNVNMTLSCQPSSKVPLLFAGADEANVNGNITLNITNGHFGKVFGGNNLGGAVKGKITVNVEETGCQPIKIDELYLGGNEAAYSIYGYYESGETQTATGKKILKPRTSATDSRLPVKPDGTEYASIDAFTNYAQPELNIISCTYIGNVFGGGYGEGAVMYANPTVNVNMVAGNHAATAVPAMMTELNLDVSKTAGNPNNIGIIRNVFGGGDAANVAGNTTVNIATEEGKSAYIIGSVFGGGNAADVLGNTNVTMSDGYVFNGVFGGGYAGNVGTSTRSTDSQYTSVFGHETHDGCIGKPISCAEGTGKCTVLVNGGQIGPLSVATQGMNRPAAEGGPVPEGWVWGAGQGLVEDPATHPDTHFTSYVGSTDVTIGGTALIMESIIGGGEFGRVLGNTLVKIEGGQIGVGEGMVDANNKPIRYTDDQFINPTTTTVTAGNALKECSHFDYGFDNDGDGKLDYLPYDPYYEDYPAYVAAHPDLSPACTSHPSDGKTWIGCVFAGGSGYMPYKKEDGSGYDWCSSAGWVEGNTEVVISGGHILTNVYGGNEYTNVKGKSIVTMTGGTIGVPRTVEQIQKNPLTCYLFGAGRGDQRTHFNKETNVGDVEVNVTGGIIYGSVFGGGEDGHVIRNAVTNIGGDVIIGTTGTSYVDGNVFGGGRGFSGEAQTAGTVGGNVELNITGGKILGSVYGGGRLASVGTEFTAPNDPNYGQFKEDDANGTYGHVVVNISGGTIGNGKDGEDVTSDVSGNVFGASMGRLTLINGDINPIWPKMAQVKSSVVNVYGNAVVKRTVFGGGELGTVRDNAYVTIGGKKTSDADANGKVNVEKDGSPVVRMDVYGGGYGSEDNGHATTIKVYLANSTNTGYDEARFRYTPMQFAGCVGQNTYVNVVGGQVRKSVYGGGEMASVGIINYQLNDQDECIGIVKHEDANNSFALSWPYEFKNFPGYPGDTHVTVTGGRIGLKGGETNTFEDKDNGDVYGGGKGIAGDFNNYIYCANVGSTNVTIDYPNTADPASYDSDGSVVECVTGAVYGGAENGHVMGDTKVTLKKGLIGHSVYGGGSGKGQFPTKLLKIGAPAHSTSESDYYTRDIYSITAGKVFGNTEVIMEDGYVVRNVYGGGNMGSVGKGNYAGGADDYSTVGYGETLSGNLWDGQSKFSEAFLNSGKSTVKILGGTVGYIASDPSESMYPANSTASLPYGNVFGGCRGESAPNIRETPRYLYSPEFFVGYVNETDVTIGDENGSGPTIIGSVYGGGMDGHVRRDTHVEVLGGEIGIPYTSENIAKVQTKDLNNTQWLARGNVYGAGSGIGKYKYDFDYDGKYTSTVKYHDKDTKEEDYSTSAGSVTRFTTVDVMGGTIYRNVYGGGSLSSVGAPKIGQDGDPYHPDDSEHSGEVGKQSLNTVTVSGGQIGDTDGTAAGYGGNVNGGSRGDINLGNSFSTAVFTDVAIDGTADVKGNVFGGGEAGMVMHDTNVKMLGGTVGNELYGGGDMADVGGNTTVSLTGGQITNTAYGGARGTADNAANVGGDVLVELNKGVAEDAKGCIVDKVFGANNVNGTPTGHVLVHVYATQNASTENISTKIGPVYSPSKMQGDSEGYIDYLSRLIAMAKPNGTVLDGIDAAKISTAEATISGKTEKSLEPEDKTAIGNAAKDVITELDNTYSYDVTNVFGGGKSSDYVSAVDEPKQSTEVIIEGCDLTSINEVYGGGYGAATPGTNVLIKGSYIINNVFGGGYGAGTDNPGANVGYKTYPLDNPPTTDEAKAAYVYGSGKAVVELIAGKLRNVYGGSNSKGDIREGSSINANTTGEPEGYEDPCDVLKVDTIYGGGKDAPMEGGTEIVLDCMPKDWVGEIYAGAANADVANDVSLTITSGKFGSVFGGNKEGGELHGSITVNIEECDVCPTPIIIGELYGGGNRAPYSIYGYYEVEEDGETVLKPRTKEMYDAMTDEEKAAEGIKQGPHRDPIINIRSFTSIGNVYGGGLGEDAELIGNPTVNINEAYVERDYAGDYSGETRNGVVIPKYIKDKDRIGVIGNVFGGGNAAKVIGNTTVNVGTEQGDYVRVNSIIPGKTGVKSYFVKNEDGTFTKASGVAQEGVTYYYLIVGPNVQGNIYGGGNAAEVTGNTNVVIGKKKE